MSIMGMSVIVFVGVLAIILFCCLRPLSISQLLVKYIEQTGHLSASSGMKKTTAFQEIITRNKESVISAIIAEIRQNGGRMSLYVLLWEVTGMRPYHPLQENGFLKFDITAEEKAWLQWAKKEGI